MKVSELDGYQLDSWVAKALLIPPALHTELYTNAVDFRPSVVWAHGGPIIEREGILVVKMREDWYAVHPEQGDTGYWGAGYVDVDLSSMDIDIDSVWMKAKTPLVAAMRAYVAIKCGEEVPDE